MRELIREMILKEFVRDSISRNVDLSVDSENVRSPKRVIELWCTRMYFDFAEDGYSTPFEGFCWYRDRQAMLDEVNLGSYSDPGVLTDLKNRRLGSLTRRSFDPRNTAHQEAIKRNFSHPPDHEATIVIYDHTERSINFPTMITRYTRDPAVILGYFYKDNPDIIRI